MNWNEIYAFDLSLKLESVRCSVNFQFVMKPELFLFSNTILLLTDVERLKSYLQKL